MDATSDFAHSGRGLASLYSRRRLFPDCDWYKAHAKFSNKFNLLFDM